MRKLILAVLFFYVLPIVKGQNLTVEGASPDLYFTHTVAPKENFYSIARLYNQAPKLIASFNNLVMEKGLAIGQQIKVPLTQQNFSNRQEAAHAPLIHIVTKGETLFRISTNYNIDVQSIRKWNNLSADNITPGTPVVIGHLKTANPASDVLVAKAAAPIAEVPAVKQEQGSLKENLAEPVKNKPVAAANEQSKVSDTLLMIERDTLITAEEQKVLSSVNENPALEKPGIATVKTLETKQPETAANPKEKLSGKPDLGAAYPAANNTKKVAEGSFSEIYLKNASKGSEVSKRGQAGTFKSVSGWQDKKYYILMNDINPGTIVKVSAGTNEFIYAKVLGSLPEIKENNGLLLRISNAAAAYLGIVDPKFEIDVNFYKE